VIRLQFTEEEIEALRYEHFHYPHPRVQMKMGVALLKGRKKSIRTG
jgi:hypothetical protein